MTASTLLTALALTTVIALPPILKWIRHSLTFFEPLTILSVGFLLYFVIGPLVSIATDTTSYLLRDFRPLYTLAFTGVAISVVFMWLGYFLPAGAKIGRWIAAKLSTPLAYRRQALQMNLMRQAGILVTVGGAVGLVSSFAFGRGSLSSLFLPGVVASAGQASDPNVGSLNYLYLMMDWFIPGFLLLMCGRRFRRRWLLPALAATILVIYASVGFRFRIVVFLLGIAVIWYVTRPSTRRVALLAIGGALVVLIAGFVGASRQYYRTGGSAGSAIPNASRVVDFSRSDTRIFESFAAVLDAVPGRIPYVGIKPIESILVLPIPRGLWPEKPTPEYLQAIPQAIGTPAARFAGAAVPNFGEYYLAFGWFGLSVGMIVFGLGARALWSFWVWARRDNFALVVYACSLPFLLQIVSRGYTAQIVQEWFFIVFPAIVVARLGRKRLLQAQTIGSASSVRTESLSARRP